MSSLTERRAKAMGSRIRQYYDHPFNPVKGKGAWLYDQEGRAYLDTYNNVPHLGHCHPAVVEAIARQSAELNVHTRYLHEAVVAYAERLLSTLPPELDVAMFTCTGSESNDLAWRMAMVNTGARGAITTRHCYHGNTTVLRDMDRSGGEGDGVVPDWVARVPAPEFSVFVNAGTPDDYAAHVQAAIAELAGKRIRPAAFLFDASFCSDGVFITPHSFLQKAIAKVREAGGIIIADEVQCGLGRFGHHMWGFEQLGIVPDILTLGKSTGNGYPIGAVIARREIAEKFYKQDRYFNTFAGNPVASTAGLTVLDVIEKERLRENAVEVGTFLKQSLQELGNKHDIIGDVRGEGFLLGIELVRDRRTREAAGIETTRFINEMVRAGVVMGTTGPGRPNRNTVKIRPPMVFARSDVDFLIQAMDHVLPRL